jgi:hypothetical protein
MSSELSLSRSEPCVGCGVQIGREHSAGCREMHCLRTGLLLALCPGQHGHRGGGVRTGMLPGEGTAVAFGWFCRTSVGAAQSALPDAPARPTEHLFRCPQQIGGIR